MSAADRALPLSPAEAAVLLADFASHPALVLAVSGGPDSTALLFLCARWRAGLETGPRLVAVTVDHGLRADLRAEARGVKRLAGALGVEHRTLAWTGKKPATGLPAAARAARYWLLAAAAREAGATLIVTAHTLDDQAETVIMRLARGSGLSGLAGMDRVAPLPQAAEPLWEAGRAGMALARPFLAIPKARLVATLAAAGIDYATDPSNSDDRFTRPRIRRLMPRLAQEGIDAVRLARLARRLARADRAIEAMVDDAQSRLVGRAPGGAVEFDATAFRALPEEIALRLLGRLIEAAGNEGLLELAKLEALFEAVRAPGAGLRRTLAGALVSSDGRTLRVGRAPPRRTAACRNARPVAADRTLVTIGRSN